MQYQLKIGFMAQTMECIVIYALLMAYSHKLEANETKCSELKA